MGPMRFTAQEEYGLRCLMQVARAPEGSLTIPEVADREALSLPYVAKIMRHLRSLGLVTATRGQKGGYVTGIEQETVPRGLNEETGRLISAKKNEPEFMLEWRLKAYRQWLTMKEPSWQNVHYPPIDYQDMVYYAAPKSKSDGPKSL